MSTHQNSKDLINDAIIREIREAIDGLKFGTVLITVHNKKITQIEVTEKKRFDNIWTVEAGAGI